MSRGIGCNNRMTRTLLEVGKKKYILRGQQTVVVRSTLWNVPSLVRLLFFYELLRSKSLQWNKQPELFRSDQSLSLCVEGIDPLVDIRKHDKQNNVG